LLYHCEFSSPPVHASGTCHREERRRTFQGEEKKAHPASTTRTSTPSIACTASISAALIAAGLPTFASTTTALTTAASTPAYAPPKTPDRDSKLCSFSGLQTGQRSSFSGYSTARYRVLNRSSIGHLQGSQQRSPSSPPRTSPDFMFGKFGKQSSVEPTGQLTSAERPPNVSSVSSVPPSAGRLDGAKEFFRQVRARMPRQDCSQFLHDIKELEAHQKTPEETLQAAADLFGPKNTDLYKAFASMVEARASAFATNICNLDARRVTY